MVSWPGLVAGATQINSGGRHARWRTGTAISDTKCLVSGRYRHHGFVAKSGGGSDADQQRSTMDGGRPETTYSTGATQLTASLERIRVWGEANNRNIACNLNPGLTQEQILELASQQPRPLPAEICGKAGAKGRVYEELLGSAERSIWASTYAFFDGPKAFEVLARRMERTPALRVTLLLNIQRKGAILPLP